MAVHKNILLLLGSNLGDREKSLLVAIRKINEQAGTVVAASSLYRTQPWGETNQPEFLNQVIVLESPHTPRPLLALLQSIEKELGRERVTLWGPRIIDVDILFFGNDIVNEKDLAIPHPAIPYRRFTLVPLCEIAPKFVHPVLNKSCEQLLRDCHDPLEVNLFDPTHS
jgi:2-amino-4-hydroxy-6-hydroxymethyldihydropteridine diphosphokinase